MENHKALQVAIDQQLTREEIEIIMNEILKIKGVTDVVKEITWNVDES